ncbi:acidic mammalian chitinase-like [Zootermopsis nevadensis]|uniref:acidic mammalian chitinase-like n=1 Tax=Zootermopsis nevadensis TaxID=136037 RepID=UPI000B8E2380|nr:acidic mammalian chitinase-like [Zootermopsis nevadensis]
MSSCRIISFSLFLFAVFQVSHLADVQNDAVVFCYYGSWATYRPGIAQFNVENINASLCTHVAYTFMGLKDGVIVSLDEYNDFEENWGKGSLKKLSAFAKSSGIKAVLAIGGWNEGSITYSEVAATEIGRNKFSDSVVAFAQKFNFDGVDLDWEYPTQRGGSPHDKENFSLLLKTLSEKLHAEGLTLTVAVCADPVMAEESYDFEEVARNVDYISLMAFDYHTASSGKVTGLNSGLHALSSETGDDAKLNAEYSVNQWLDGGVPPSKLLLGIPLYGRTYILADPEQHGLGAPTIGNGVSGPYTQEPGFLSYYEICKETEWNIVRNDQEGYVYAHYDDNWVSYDDISAVAAKAQFVKDKRLAGIMTWALESEDFRNTCGEGANPLLTTANKVLGRL